MLCKPYSVRSLQTIAQHEKEVVWNQDLWFWVFDLIPSIWNWNPFATSCKKNDSNATVSHVKCSTNTNALNSHNHPRSRCSYLSPYCTDGDTKGWRHFPRSSSQYRVALGPEPRKSTLATLLSASPFRKTLSIQDSWGQAYMYGV